MVGVASHGSRDRRRMPLTVGAWQACALYGAPSASPTRCRGDDDLAVRLHPIHIGQLVTLKSSVNRVFRTSMEVGVKVFIEDLHTREVKHTSSAYLTFVALDKVGQKIAVTPVLPQTEAELRRYEEAGQRRALRLAQKPK